MPRKKPALAPGAQPRGRGRPSHAELALRAAAAAQAHAPTETRPSGDFPVPGPDAPRATVVSALNAPPEPFVTPVLPPAPPSPPVASPPAPQDVSLMSEEDRGDPRKLHGQALRDFAHGRGIARSEMETWADQKVRDQVSLIIHRQYHEHA